MNVAANIRIGHSACPHDCPSTCALDVEVIDGRRISRLHGAKDNSYTAGVICAKVARYAERIHHPDRLLKPLVRSGAKGEGGWKEASWEAALDLVAEKLVAAEEKHGSETVWPYYYAGTMGQVQRDSINRLRHAKKYSGFFDSICTNLAWTGYVMGTGALRGADPREMAKSDCVVIWGTNAVVTQVNVMTHAVRARKERDAKIVVIDIYENATMKQADMGLVVKPGTDGALACAVMHILFRDDLADRAYLERYADDPKGLEEHLRDKTPEWASAITGLSVAEIEAFARLVGATKRTFFRLGYGFARQRNGSVNMHAALSVSVVTGCWQYEGGGALNSNSGMSGYKFDHSRIGPVLVGHEDALFGGPPVTALLIQNTNPVNVAPEQRLVKRGFLRDDLFTCVHEQFMTDTAKLADVVLPATMFLEHDDLYKGGGNQFVTLGSKQVEPPEGPRTNHFVIEELARRLGVSHLPGFGLSEREHIDIMLKSRGLCTFDTLLQSRWVDVQEDFETAHFLKGFGHPDGKFRFRPQWVGGTAPNKPPKQMGVAFGPYDRLPEFPDHVELFRDAELDRARRPAGAAHSSGGRRCARPRRRRPGRDRKHPRRSGSARKTVRRGAARRGDRGRHLAELRA
jgi:anaerobic selenocysteine-containing dehydrogenase